MMVLALNESLRRALASALRTEEEHFALAQSLQEQAIVSPRKRLAALWARRAQEYQKEAGETETSARHTEAAKPHGDRRENDRA